MILIWTRFLFLCVCMCVINIWYMFILQFVLRLQGEMFLAVMLYLKRVLSPSTVAYFISLSTGTYFLSIVLLMKFHSLSTEIKVHVCCYTYKGSMASYAYSAWSIGWFLWDSFHYTSYMYFVFSHQACILGIISVFYNCVCA